VSYKDNETVNITLERYEDLKESSECLYKLINSLANSSTITPNKELLINKEKIRDVYIQADRMLYMHCLKLGSKYDDVELENIKFKKVESDK